MKASGIKAAPIGFHKDRQERRQEAAARKYKSPRFGKHSSTCKCGVHPECRMGA